MLYCRLLVIDTGPSNPKVLAHVPQILADFRKFACKREKKRVIRTLIDCFPIEYIKFGKGENEAKCGGSSFI